MQLMFIVMHIISFLFDSEVSWQRDQVSWPDDMLCDGQRPLRLLSNAQRESCATVLMV